MIRKLLATTAVATLLATGAMAQTDTGTGTATGTGTGTTTAAPAEQPMEKKAEGDLASNLIGKTVYNGTGDDAENIGEVNDLVIGKDGQVTAIVVGVGGFLGLGEKSVALEYDAVERAQKDDDEWLVVETTTDALKAQEEFDPDAYEPMPADADVSETKPVSKEELGAAPSGDDAAAGSDEGGADASGGAAMESDDSSGAASGEDSGGAMSDDGASSDSGSGSGAATEGSGDADSSMKSDDSSGAASGDDSDAGAATEGSDSSGGSMDEEKPADDSSSK